MRYALLTLALFCGAASTGYAQRISNTDIEYNLGVGAHVPYDGAPFSHRYFYNVNTGANIYINGDGRNLWYLDWADRASRAYQAKKELPPDPFVYPDHPANGPVPSSAVAPARRLGLGFFRARY